MWGPFDLLKLDIWVVSESETLFLFLLLLLLALLSSEVDLFFFDLFCLLFQLAKMLVVEDISNHSLYNFFV